MIYVESYDMVSIIERNQNGGFDMKKSFKILNSFLVLVLLFGLLSIHTVSAQESLTQQEIFEAIVKKANGFDPNEDMVLEQEHYDAAERVSTMLEYPMNGWNNPFELVYLNDFSYLEKLTNMKELSIHVPTVIDAFEYDVNYLNTLPYERLTLGTRIGYSINDSETGNIQKNQVKLLEMLDRPDKVEVRVAKFGVLDNDFLLGVDLKPSIALLTTIDEEANMRDLALDFAFSHEANGVRYYKTHVANPFATTLTLDESAHVIADPTRTNSEWDLLIFDQDSLRPIFYDVSGNVVAGQDEYWSYLGKAVDSMDVFFTEDELNEIISRFVDYLSYLGSQITNNYEFLYETEALLVGETDPAVIEDLNETIAFAKELIAELEQELLQLKTEGTSSETKVVDFTIMQKGVDTTQEHFFETSQRFYGNLRITDDIYQTHTVTFDSNGGTRIPQLREIKTNSKIAEPVTPTKGSIAFEGWFKEASLTTPWDFDTDVVTEDITLYAKWDEIIHDVHFDSKGGTAIDSQRIVDQELVVKPSDPTYLGHTFEGWYLDQSYTTQYDFTSPVSNGLTLYAKWNKIPVNYTVTFDSKGGSLVDAQSVLAGTTASVPNDPTQSGYTFGGWFSDETYSLSYDFTTPVNDNLTLFAKWDKVSVSHIVSFESNGGSSVDDQTVLENTKAVEPLTPTRDGFTFKGWYRDTTFENMYNFDQLVTEDLTLYAKWSQDAINPIDPVDPIDPVKPIDPVQPTDPVQPEPTLPETGVGNMLNNFGMFLVGFGILSAFVGYYNKRKTV